MKLSSIAILALRGCTPEIKKKLADALGVTVPSINRYLRDNDDSLTKVAALEVIREVTGLTDDQILEKDNEKIESQS
jgi:transcriptional regulator with XRE-family HTH domain